MSSNSDINEEIQNLRNLMIDNDEQYKHLFGSMEDHITDLLDYTTQQIANLNQFLDGLRNLPNVQDCDPLFPFLDTYRSSLEKIRKELEDSYTGLLKRSGQDFPDNLIYILSRIDEFRICVKEVHKMRCDLENSYDGISTSLD